MSSCYKINMPNGFKKNLYYNIDTDKITLIKEQVLDYWEEYLYSHFVWSGKFNPVKLNYEDKTKMLLDRCATFLLLDDNKNYNINSDRKRKNIYNNEILLSSMPDDVNDAIYSVDADEITQTPKRSSSIQANEILSGNKDYMKHENIHKKRLNKIERRYKDSYQYKIKNLYTTEDKKIKILYKLKNKDIEYNIPNPAFTEKELLIWQNKNFRNIFGENIYDYKTKTIKGKKGLMNKNKPYIWKWCYVNTENEFMFNNQKYKIDNSLDQYQKKDIANKNLDYEMDSILCYKQGNNQYYFDQRIDQIRNDLVQQI